ncbi:sugar transferase [Peribacillus simplex]|uniref:sugar transferase n=1 Tax=Peribacillus simplex TaxID=1478 RepID=UPI002989EEED|nr:sugar transferase [Peribacillus simplex]MBX9954131.1 sugar transferase [Peribacillus simplex]
MKPYLFFKRILDFIFSMILLIIASPIMIFASIAIKIEDKKGPILFIQNRPGKNNKIFSVYKFRTMRVETEKNGVILSDMERMTKAGSFLRRTSIDELPQLFNILRGEMSFIGPRPLLVRYLPYYSIEEQKRHNVRPGISGWAQVNGRNLVNWNDRLKLDLDYVDNISALFDMKILFLTIYKVIKREDIIVVTENPMLDLDKERSGNNGNKTTRRTNV